MNITVESLEPKEKLTVKQRILRGIGGVVCAGAGVAVLKYMPYDAHDSMAFQPMLASGLMLLGGVLETEAMRGVDIMHSMPEDSE